LKVLHPIATLFFDFNMIEFKGHFCGCDGALGHTVSTTKMTCLVDDGIIHHDQHRAWAKSSFFVGVCLKNCRPCCSNISKFLKSSCEQHYSSYDHKGGMSEVVPPSFSHNVQAVIIALTSVCGPRSTNAVPIWACVIFSCLHGTTCGI
jgi:hypothetical protein